VELEDELEEELELDNEELELCDEVLLLIVELLELSEDELLVSGKPVDSLELDELLELELLLDDCDEVLLFIVELEELDDELELLDELLLLD
jgi:hypothetical protein